MPDSTWVLELPFTTPLSLNSRMHWAAKAKATRTWRDATLVLARQARIPACRRAWVQLHYVPATTRRHDPLNLAASVKAVEDGIVDAHVIPDDDMAHHESLLAVIHPKGPLRPRGNRIWVVVTCLTDGAAEMMAVDRATCPVSGAEPAPLS